MLFGGVVGGCGLEIQVLFEQGYGVGLVVEVVFFFGCQFGVGVVVFWYLEQWVVVEVVGVVGFVEDVVFLDVFVEDWQWVVGVVYQCQYVDELCVVFGVWDIFYGFQQFGVVCCVVLVVGIVC